MSKSRSPQRAPAHEPAAPQQAPAEHDAEMAEAQQLGNGAMQERMGAQQADAAGLDGVEGAIDAVIDWTWEQIGSADDLRRYVEAVGLDAAMALIHELAREAPGLLEAFLAEVAVVDDLAWAVLEALADVAVFLGLPLAAQAQFVVEALHRGSSWLIDALGQVDPHELLALVKLLSEGDLERLREIAEDLYLSLLDAVWEPGLGVTFEAEVSVDLEVVDTTFSMSLGFRHRGRGVFEVVREIRGGADVGLDKGGDGEKKKQEGEEEAGAGLELTLGAEGFYIETYDVPYLGLGAAGLYAQVLTSLHVESFAQLLGTSFGLVEPVDFLTSVELGGGARLSGGAEGSTGEGSDDPMELALKLAASAGLEGSVVLSALTPDSCDVELTATLDALLEVGGAMKLGDDLKVALGSLDEDVGGRSELTLSFHLAIRGEEPLVSDVTVSRTDTVDAGRAEVGLGVEMGVEASVPASVEEFLERVQGLTVSASIGASDELAAAWLEQAGLAGTLGGGTWALMATVELSASLDLDAVQFVASVVAEAFAARVGEEGLVDTLLAWAAQPLQSTPVEALQLLATELAMAGDLSLTITGEASQAVEGDGGVIGGSAEVTLDIERDLLAMGAAVTTDHLVKVLTGDLAAGRERELAA